MMKISNGSKKRCREKFPYKGLAIDATGLNYEIL